MGWVDKLVHKKDEEMYEMIDILSKEYIDESCSDTPFNKQDMRNKSAYQTIADIVNKVFREYLFTSS